VSAYTFLQIVQGNLARDVNFYQSVAVLITTQRSVVVKIKAKKDIDFGTRLCYTRVILQEQECLTLLTRPGNIQGTGSLSAVNALLKPSVNSKPTHRQSGPCFVLTRPLQAAQAPGKGLHRRHDSIERSAPAGLDQKRPPRIM
jgi:hypothetical protein